VASLYSFLTGPALWLTFIVSGIGMIVRIAYLYGLSLGKDRVFYNHQSFEWGAKSIAFWLIPWGSVALRLQPVFSFMVFAFHVTLLAVPIFLSAHNMLWDEAFNLSLWSMPDTWSDALTVVMMISGAFLLIRRIVRPEVRILTEARDYILLFMTILPFATGFMAYHHIGAYKTMLILHILSGEILLILLPFTKLAHVVLFFFTRAFIGFEMGGRRGAKAW
jgi:nitrate reductase gamma subunit